MGMYPLIEDADRKFVAGLVAQGMSEEDAEQYLADTLDRLGANEDREHD